MPAMKSSKITEGDCLTTKQSVLDKWFLRQDIINQLLDSGEESESAAKFAERIMPVVEAEESEYQLSLIHI